ncbi:hypothetical protein FS837_007958 [Tulasnella sp. UAMH 9824]|nr:hypothetical protein FS837_007958 [Tulasnella sp. UAMH 9824]
MGSDSVHVFVDADDMFVTSGHIEFEIAENRTKMGGLDAGFMMPTFDECQRVFQGLGAIVGSKSIFLHIGFWDEIDITDFLETLKNVPNFLPSVQSIQIWNAHSSLVLLGLLSQEYVGDLGQVTWLASALEELVFSYSDCPDYESTMSALRRLWLERYARLEANGGLRSAVSLKGCSKLSKLSLKDQGLVARVKEEGLFSGTAVDIFRTPVVATVH